MVSLTDALNTLEHHGDMCENNDAGTVITVTTAGTYYGWVSASAGELENVTFSSNATADRLVVPVGGAGTYDILANVSFAGTGSALIKGAIHINGTINNNLKFRRKMGAGGDTGNSSVPLKRVVLADGDYVDLRFTSDGNGDTLTIYDCCVAIRRVER